MKNGIAMQAARSKSNEDWLFSVENLNVQIQDTHYLRRYFAALSAA